MGDEMLASVCELAFDVAKEGSAPSAMKNYLYLAQRPPRAYSVAQRALEEDIKFRARVAERATIENVGEAGYLWLHRPAGWERRFADLNAGVEPVDGSSMTDTPLAQRPPIPEPPTAGTRFVPSTPAASAQTPSTQIPGNMNPSGPQTAPVPQPAQAPRSPQPAQAVGAGPTVNSIEDELSSLRGLVDRLADERQNVRSSVSDLEVELDTRRAENVEMSTKLSSLRTELTTVQSTEASILLERDRALARVTELEADVARLATEVERLAAETEGSSAEHEAALTDLATVSFERDRLRTELDSMASEREVSLTDLQSLRSERDLLAEAATQRDSLQGELDAVVTDRNSLSGQFNDVRLERDQVSGQLSAVIGERDESRGERDQLSEQLSAVTGERDESRGERDRLSEQLSAVTGERDESRGERDQLSQQILVVTGERDETRSELSSAEAKGADMAEELAALDQLRADNTELASRLSVAEQARIDLEGQLEEVSEKWQGSARQLSVFTNVNSQLDAAVAERKETEAQLVQANDVLATLHQRIGTSHDQIRSELSGIEAAFGGAPQPLVDNDHDETDSNDLSIDGDGDGDVDAGVEVDESQLVDAFRIDAAAHEAGAVPTTGDDAASDGDAVAEAFRIPTADMPAFETPGFDAHEIEAPDLLSNLDAASFEDVADLGGVEPEAIDLEHVFEAEHLFETEPGFDPESETEADDDFDGEGIELDPNTLGGRTIGDMFGGGEGELPDGDVNQPSTDAAHPIETNGVVEADEIAPLGSNAVTGRRKPSMPIGLDAAAYAQQLVASPDIVLLIDGDGAAGLGWPHLDVATRRSALVDYLGSLTAHSGAAADVVFARPVGGEDALPVSPGVRVRIADAGVADNPIFASIVNGYPEEWPIAIVTNEPSLTAQAEALDVAVLSNDQLLDLFLDLNPEE